MDLSRGYSYVKGGKREDYIQKFDSGFATSWLDPNGEFHSIVSWKSHEQWAIKHGYSIRELFEKGWMRVTFIGGTLIACNDFDVPINHAQVNSIVDFAIVSRKFNEVVYEGSSHDRPIWVEE